MLFEIGKIVVTRNADKTLDHSSIILALQKYVKGNWGDLCIEDIEANQEALKYGLRLFAVYYDKNNTKFYIITEADRSITTILLPEDY